MKIAIMLMMLIIIVLGVVLFLQISDDDTKYKIQWKSELVVDPDEEYTVAVDKGKT